MAGNGATNGTAAMHEGPAGMGVVEVLVQNGLHGTKGAVRLLTKTAAVEFASDGIRVNSIHPGYIDTAMLREVTGDFTPEQIEAVVAGAVPLGRLGVAEDIAAGALYLASDESSYVTGSELVIDGGVTAR